LGLRKEPNRIKITPHIRIGAVNYLNSKPLVEGLEELEPQVRLLFDLPSRLADSLAAGRMDVALIPSVEYFRTAGYSIVSDACVAAQGPVLSVKLHFRVPPAEVRRLALDEGSRTSAALAQILLAEMCGVRPKWELLPIGCGVESSDADAVLLIGDRAIAGRGQGAGSTEFQEIWDLGERWSFWTGLPFVFAMWVARPNVNAEGAAAILTAARDRGLNRLADIAETEAEMLGIDRELATRYLCENLHFTLGRAERSGLRRFYQLCEKHDLAPAGLDSSLKQLVADGRALYKS
jgi:chorismate dehydratase